MRNYGAILLLLAAAPLYAAPPTLTLPPEVTGDVAAFVVVKAKTDGKVVKFVALDPGLNVFPAELLSDPTATVVTSARAGRFRLLAYTGTADGPSEPAVCAVVIGGSTVPPPLPPPDKPPPDNPPPPATLFFLVIRPDGPASPEFTKTMENAAWGELVAAGHKFKEKTLTESKAWGYVPPPGTTLPAVLTLRVEGSRSKEARGPVPLPTTADGIRALPEGVK